MFWCQIKETGEYFAYSEQAFDIDIQKEIVGDVWDRQNLDFPLTEITEDEEARNIIRESGFFYKKPSDNWELRDQKTASIQEPSFCYTTNPEYPVPPPLTTDDRATDSEPINMLQVSAPSSYPPGSTDTYKLFPTMFRCVP